MGSGLRIGRFEDIEAWQLVREGPLKVYGLEKKTVFAGDFGLKGQIWNATGSSRTSNCGGIRFGKKP